MNRAERRRMASKVAPGVHYHAAIASHPNTGMALAIAHMSLTGPVLDEIKVFSGAPSEADVSAVYAGLRAQGFSVTDDRELWRRNAIERGADIRTRAIADAFERVRAS